MRRLTTILLATTMLTADDCLAKESCTSITSPGQQEYVGTPYGSQSEQAKQIMGTINLLKQAVIDQRLETISKHLHDDCTSLNEHTKTLISGKEKVLERFKEVMQRFSPRSETPLQSYEIEHPYISVRGDVAIATYSATAKFAGATPKSLHSNITEVYVKEKVWKRLHYRCHWNLAVLTANTGQNEPPKDGSKPEQSKL